MKAAEKAAPGPRVEASSAHYKSIEQARVPTGVLVAIIGLLVAAVIAFKLIHG